MATFRIHPAMISILILLVVFTLLFTFLVIHESNQISEMLEGATGDSPNAGKPTLTKLKSDEAEESRKIASAQDAIAARKREIYRADLELDKFRYYMAGDKVLAGIATPDQKELDGKPLKDGSWATTRDLIAISVHTMDAMRQEHESDVRQKFPLLETAIKNRQDELQAVLKKINDQEAQLQEDTKRLQDQLDVLGKDKEKAEKANRESYSRRATRIGQLEDRIRSLLELELHWLGDHEEASTHKMLHGDRNLDPVGQVLEVSAEDPHLVINLGSADRVTPGLIFEVFQYDHGRYVEKGMVEVVQTQAQIATCRVLSVVDPKRFPLSKDDNLGNPVFSTKRPPVFVVSGEFKVHNKEDLEMFIRQTGGIVRDKLSPGVDYLVAGERSEKDQDNAREYQVQAMSEAQLLKYVRRDFKPK
jgi:hypothetical protein